MLKSQKLRKVAPEVDPLRIGMGWTSEELKKPQIKLKVLMEIVIQVVLILIL